MEIKRRTEITIETRERTIIRICARQSTEAFCEECRAAQSHLSVRRAAALLRLSEMSIFRLVESRELHSTETAAGALLVCGNSLAALIEG